MSKERKIFGKWTQYGFSFKRFALGFHIDKYSLSLDLIFGWITVEL